MAIPLPEPGKDVRLFYLLTGESEASLRRGQQVLATVVRLSTAGVGCKMGDTGLRAFIPIDQITDREDLKSMDPDARMRWLEAKIREGAQVHARVKDIRFDKFELILTSTGRDLRDRAKWERRDDIQDDYVITTPSAEEVCTATAR